MRKDRRAEDKCIIKRIYAHYTPHVQILGWLVVVCTVIVSGLLLGNTANAAINKVDIFEAALKQNKQRIDEVEAEARYTAKENSAKLDLVIQLLKRGK